MFAAEAELPGTRVQGRGARPPPFSFGVVGPGMMGTEAEGRQTPIPSCCFLLAVCGENEAWTWFLGSPASPPSLPAPSLLLVTPRLCHSPAFSKQEEAPTAVGSFVFCCGLET